MNSAKYLICTKAACGAIAEKNGSYGKAHNRIMMPVETADGVKVVPATLATSDYWAEYHSILAGLKTKKSVEWPKETDL